MADLTDMPAWFAKWKLDRAGTERELGSLAGNASEDMRRMERRIDEIQRLLSSSKGDEITLTEERRALEPEARGLEDQVLTVSRMLELLRAGGDQS